MYKHFERLDSVVPIIPEDWLRFYACELVLGLEELHTHNTIYRDLKPENVLVDRKGHLLLSDFGLSIELEQSKDYMTKGAVGTLKYIAPECKQGHAYSFSCDFYSLGVLLMWMFEGHSDVERMLEGEKNSYTAMSSAARNIVLRLIEEDPTKRLGAHKGWVEVKAHRFFRTVDWSKIRHGLVTPPVVPLIEEWAENKPAGAMSPNPSVLSTPVNGTPKPSKLLGSPMRHFEPQKAAPPPPLDLNSSDQPEEETPWLRGSTADISGPWDSPIMARSRRVSSITGVQQALFAAFDYPNCEQNELWRRSIAAASPTASPRGSSFDPFASTSQTPKSQGGFAHKQLHATIGADQMALDAYCDKQRLAERKAEDARQRMLAAAEAERKTKRKGLTKRIRKGLSRLGFGSKPRQPRVVLGYAEGGGTKGRGPREQSQVSSVVLLNDDQPNAKLPNCTPVNHQVFSTKTTLTIAEGNENADSGSDSEAPDDLRSQMSTPGPGPPLASSVSSGAYRSDLSEASLSPELPRRVVKQQSMFGRKADMTGGRRQPRIPL